MGVRHNCSSLARRKFPAKPLWFGAALTILAFACLLGGYETARMEGAWARLHNAPPGGAASTSVLPALLSEREPSRDLEEISRLEPQEQAERLLERAIDHSEISLDLIRQRMDGWRGRLESTERLFALVIKALDSSDLRVRAAAIEIDLASNSLNKSPQSVARLRAQLRGDPGTRSMALWRLGALGNRGIEPEKVFHTLLDYAHSRNENTRFWAIEGLAMLGSDASVAPLLEAFAHDPSPRVRRRAGCSLAQSGMLTKEQRMETVPDLLNLLDDDSLDAPTRGLVYGVLRTITGEALGNDANAWREWWGRHDRIEDHARHVSNLSRA